MTTHTRQERNHMHLYAAMVRDGYKPTEDDIKDMKMTRAWCDAILNGESLDVGTVYMKAFRKETV